MSLGDLDELVISCRTEEARSYVSGAVDCYKAGAFRACIVAAWIAVVLTCWPRSGSWRLAAAADRGHLVRDHRRGAGGARRMTWHDPYRCL
jgi:hypothetical protein